MNIKSKIIFLICIISIGIFLVACDKNEEKNNDTNPVVEDSSISKNVDIVNDQSSIVVPKIYKDYDDFYEAEELFSCVSDISNLTQDNEISDVEAKKRYHLTDIEDVKIVLRSNMPETLKQVNGNEIAIIQIPNSNKTVDVMKAISYRLEFISEFSEDKKEQYIIAQKEGNLIVIISENARNIYDKLSTEFNIEN